MLSMYPLNPTNLTNAIVVPFQLGREKQYLFKGSFMYCPQCSQQQVSDEMRFCSRCGFPLSGVRQVIASGGSLVGRDIEPQGSQVSKGLRGVRKGLKIMLASLPLVFVVALLSAINDGFAVLGLIPFLCLVVGFARLLYGAFLEERTSRVKRGVSQSHVTSVLTGPPGADVRRPELSPPRVAPIQGFTVKNKKTAEVVQPPSVTENTTRLLDEDTDSHRR
jgi:hypothetical protein